MNAERELKFNGHVPADKDLAIQCECGKSCIIPVSRKTARVDITCQCGKVFQVTFQNNTELN